ncbi:MAG: cytochrome C [Bacteroidales bacterium]|nr:cytochrome C [Bacteroidales bacterium]
MTPQKTILLFLLQALLFGGISAFGQLSPGDLAEVHAHLEGLSNCTKCHTLGNKVSDDKCLDCHKEIKNLIGQNRGYHVSLEVKTKNCFECHNDHHGRNFQIIRFEADKFDHNLSGYELSGAHSKKDCKDCHKPDFIVSSKYKEKKNTYLGLETACLSCHKDYHQGTLPANCSECHTLEKFKPAPKFDHNKAKFQLRGKHQTLECIKCHKIGEKDGEKYQEFIGIEYANCTNCHEDVHKNKFGTNCIKCHNEESFHEIKNLDVLDHDRTSFPLKGKHIAVECKKCHKTNYTNPLPHASCLDCHEDYHKGQFIRDGKNTECTSCHSVQGFQGSSYTIERHADSKFPLTGAHVATPCFACHKKNEEWNFKKTGINCIDCHTDIHDLFIDKKYYPEADCKKCHETSRWRTIFFDHQLTEFKLLDAHAKLTCRDCHFPETGGIKVQRFKELNAECIQCHQDIHYSQFETGGKTDCLRCHAFTDWKAEKFDHDKTRFVLDGKHRDVACIQCHKEVTVDNKTYIKYRLERFKCEDCH